MKQHFALPKALPNKKTLYVNARLFDPATGLDSMGALLTEGEYIVALGPDLEQSAGDVEVVDCKGLMLAPGLIDIQVHFREPGQTHKETLESGSTSAASGGITTVVCQPNTSPVIDNAMVLEFIKAKAKETAYVNILAYASISKDMKGQEMTEMSKLVEAGAVGFTDDGLPVMNALLMRRALSYSTMLKVPIVQHAEDLNLSQGGCINEGEVSFKLGVTGIPNISESVIVARDIAILELTGGHYHVLHVSTKESLEYIRLGKQKGLNVTCEAAPHHFLLTDEAVLGFNTFAKMNPPLRSEQDRLAIIEALRDGTIDVIATDHAPHDLDSKQLPLAQATFGIVGVETMLPLALELYYNYQIPLREVMKKMTCNAASVINSPAGVLKEGAPADLVLIDLDHEWEIDIHKFHSKSHNSPFHGRKVRGKAMRTIVRGSTVYSME
jgi:dihydroorotase